MSFQSIEIFYHQHSKYGERRWKIFMEMEQQNTKKCIHKVQLIAVCFLLLLLFIEYEFCKRFSLFVCNGNWWILCMQKFIPFVGSQKNAPKLYNNKSNNNNNGKKEFFILYQRQKKRTENSHSQRAYLFPTVFKSFPFYYYFSFIYWYFLFSIHQRYILCIVSFVLFWTTIYKI